MMKKLFWTILAVSILVVFLSCDDDSSNPLFYYYEGARVSMSDYNTLQSIMGSGSYTYTEILNARNWLRGKTLWDSFSGTDCTQADLYTFLTTRGYTPSKANTAISNLNASGNAIGWFNYNPDPTNYVVWIYIERQ
jgi:hypothetical protein